MTGALLYLSAIVIVATAVLHSALGERLLIGPLTKSRDGVMRSPLARRVLRLAWHFTSVLMVLTAAGLVFATHNEGGSWQGYVALLGAAYLLVGLITAVLTRFRHVGWLPLTLAGVLALASLA